VIAEHGEQHGEPGHAWVAGDGYRAAVGGDHGVDDGESEAGAVARAVGDAGDVGVPGPGCVGAGEPLEQVG
jgi:hypothetical protein